MRYKVDITPHPSWWHRYAGVDFGRDFFFDAAKRTEYDRDMRRALYEQFGEFGLGEKDPAPRGVLFSDLIACGFLYSQLLGCEVSFSAGDAPQVRCAELSDEASLAISPPLLSENKLWQEVEKQISWLETRFGEFESAINLQGIQNIALDLRGQQLFVDYYDEPELARNLLSCATQLSLDIGKRLYAVSPVISGGVTSIIKQALPQVYLTSNCSVTMISNAMYCKFLLEYDTRLAEAFPCFGVHHCGGNMENVIDGYLQLPNLRFLEIGAGSNLFKISEALRQKEQNDIVCNIRFSPVKLKQAHPDEVRAHIDEAVAAFGPEANLCFSCVGIDADTEPGQIKTYLSAFL